MKPQGIVVLVLVSCLLGFAGLACADDYEDSEILIRLQPGVLIDTINARYNTTTTEEEVPGVTYKVRVADPSLLNSTITAMSTDPDLVWTQNSYFGDFPELGGSRRTLAVVDGDPSKYHDQQVLQRIKVAEAHRYSTGQGVLVAVIDTGVDYNHPDLANHVLRDPVTNKVIGWDFVDNDDDPMDATDGIDNDNDKEIDEGAGHGTHVAGIIALVAPDAKIVPLRVLDSDGNGTADHVAAAIRYFIHNIPGDKKVINLSLGIPNVDRIQIIHDAIDDEIDAAGLPINVVASAGNDGLPVAHYPANEGEVLSIAAVGPNDVKADFSNYKQVDVAAPGVGIYSTFLNGQYASWDGTSMATPFVSGEVALLRAMESGTPLTPDAMETAVQQGVDNIDALNPGIDVGSGRINLLKAVQKTSGLTVKKAVYVTLRQKLILKMQSDFAPGDSLYVQGFGAMTYDALHKVYSLVVKKLAPMPASVTVTSLTRSVDITVSIQAK